MVYQHLKDNIIQCFNVDNNIKIDISNKQTQNHIINNINQFLTVHFRVKKHIENIFKILPKTHYAGTLSRPLRKKI